MSLFHYTNGNYLRTDLNGLLDKMQVRKITRSSQDSDYRQWNTICCGIIIWTRLNLNLYVIEFRKIYWEFFMRLPSSLELSHRQHQLSYLTAIFFLRYHPTKRKNKKNILNYSLTLSGVYGTLNLFFSHDQSR